MWPSRGISVTCNRSGRNRRVFPGFSYSEYIITCLLIVCAIDLAGLVRTASWFVCAPRLFRNLEQIKLDSGEPGSYPGKEKYVNPLVMTPKKRKSPGCDFVLFKSPAPTVASLKTVANVLQVGLSQVYWEHLVVCSRQRWGRGRRPVIPGLRYGIFMLPRYETLMK